MDQTQVQETARWYTSVVSGRHRPTADEIVERFGPELVGALGADTLAAAISALPARTELAGPAEVSIDGFRVELVLGARVNTFVCQGGGRPVGRPILEVDASPAERALFDPVDRSRGDTLLAVAWAGEPPAGWRD